MLAYAHQSRECANYEMASLNERMQEYQRQVDRETRNSCGSPTGDGMRHNSRNSQKVIEAVMQSAAKGKVKKYHFFWPVYQTALISSFLIIDLLTLLSSRFRP